MPFGLVRLSVLLNGCNEDTGSLLVQWMFARSVNSHMLAAVIDRAACTIHSPGRTINPVLPQERCSGCLSSACRHRAAQLDMLPGSVGRQLPDTSAIPSELQLAMHLFQTAFLDYRRVACP